jgi:hypothetical protein
MRDDEALARARRVLEETSEFTTDRTVFEDPVAKWRRQGDELIRQREAARAELRAEELDQQREAAENHTEAWIAYFERRLAEEQQDIIEGVGMAIGQVRSELRKQISELRAELTTLKSANVSELKRRA